jgi:peptidoglycan/LPS O-acetylase OafA/YrhL
MRFLANVSYPLYALHATMGYLGIRWMIDEGIPPLAALGLQTAIALLLAWITHKLVEMPTHRLGKAAARSIVSSSFASTATT